jgi:transposase
MPKPGPRRVQKYELEFKLKAVQLSRQPGVLVQDVAASLCIHPFMLSRWRKQVTDGVLAGRVPELDLTSVAELQRLRETESKYKRLLMEHDLLKKAIRFARDQRRRPSPLSRQTGARTR